MKTYTRNLLAILLAVAMLLTSNIAVFADVADEPPAAEQEGTFDVSDDDVELGEELELEDPVADDALDEDPEEPILDEVEEEEEEEEEEDPQPVELTAIADGVTIKVEAEAGVLAEDTTLSAIALSKEEAETYIKVIEDNTGQALDSFMVFDITLFDVEGNEVQPDGLVTVSFSNLPFGSEDDAEVFHLEPLSQMRMTGGRQANDLRYNFTARSMASTGYRRGVSFKTPHFSIYAAATTLTATYKFYVDGQDSPVDTQIIKSGEKLLEPEVPQAPEGKKFTGWFVNEDKVQFDVPITFTSTATLDAVARFSDIVHVFFMYGNDIITTKEVVRGTAVNDEGVSLVVTEEGKALSHWSTDQNGSTYDFGTPINADLVLYAVLADRYKVTFDSQGGSQVIPKYVAYNATIGELETPTRAGYEFSGWYANSSGTGAKYATTNKITSNITLYAKWTANINTPYKLVYWLENADDDGYTYKESVSKTGTTDATITVAPNDRKSGRYTYFTYKEYDTGKTIKGDGSTVVNIYYSRNEYTVRFNLNKNNSTMTINGTTYSYSTNANNQYSFTAKYDSDIANVWPTATHVNASNFYGWAENKNSPLFGTETVFVSKRLNLTPELINVNGTKTFYGRWQTGMTTYKLYYMIENLSGTSGTKYGNKYYTEDTKYTQDANSYNGNWSAKEIKGVTNVGNKIDGATAHFFYDRKEYKLEFYNPSKISDKGGAFKYGADISTLNFEPRRPSSVDSNYTFGGWFTTPAGEDGTEFNFSGKTMPENNIALYAKWIPPVHKVTYYILPGDDEVNKREIPDIPHGDSITSGALNERAIPAGLTDEDFVNWFWYVGSAFVPFDFNMSIVRDDIVLHPVWSSPDYKVTYGAGEATGTPPTDSLNYKLGAGAIALSPNGLIAPNGKVFLGWEKEGSSPARVYYPGNKINIDGNVTLVAKWGGIPQGTSIIYKPNYNTEIQAVIVELQNNGQHTILDCTFNREGYDFVGWNTEADGSGADFEVGTNVIIDGTEPNILYAQWTPKKYTITYIAEAHGSITGNESQTVNHGGSTTAVMAVPAEGYHFVKWDDGKTDATRHETNVTADATYTASFDPNTNTAYTVEHYLQDLGAATYTLGDTEDKTGTTGALTVAVAKSYSQQLHLDVQDHGRILCG